MGRNMSQSRQVVLTATVSTGAILICSLAGRIKQLSNGQSITIKMPEDNCYNLIIVCQGAQNSTASLAARAVHGNYQTVLCNINNTPSSTAFPALDARIPNGAFAEMAASKISVSKKAT